MNNCVSNGQGSVGAGKNKGKKVPAGIPCTGWYQGKKASTGFCHGTGCLGLGPVRREAACYCRATHEGGCSLTYTYAYIHIHRIHTHMHIYIHVQVMAGMAGVAWRLHRVRPANTLLRTQRGPGARRPVRKVAWHSTSTIFARTGVASSLKAVIMAAGCSMACSLFVAWLKEANGTRKMTTCVEQPSTAPRRQIPRPALRAPCSGTTRRCSTSCFQLATSASGTWLGHCNWYV